MDKKYLNYAEIINQAYDVESTYCEDRRYDFMFIHDDDITSILRSAHTYKELKRKNPNLQLVCVGGKGLLHTAYQVAYCGLKFRALFSDRASKYYSRFHLETEARRLERIAIELGIPKNEIMIAETGENTTGNLKNMSYIAKGKKSLVVCTQKNAMIFKQSADFQCNQNPERFGMKPFDFDLLVIHQSVEENARWYNFYAAGDNRVALHMFASLVRRFNIYDGKYLNKPFEPNAQLKEIAEELEKEFLIKQRLTGMKKLRVCLQYIPILWDIFWNAEKNLISENRAILAAKLSHK